MCEGDVCKASLLYEVGKGAKSCLGFRGVDC